MVLLKFGNTVEDRNYFMGASPHRPDVAGVYSNDGNYAGNRNPFATYYNSGEEDSRNIKFYATGINATSFSFRFIESLMISPFIWGQDDVQALFGIQHFDLTLNFENLARILSGTIDGWIGELELDVFKDGNINNISVTVPELLVHIAFNIFNPTKFMVNIPRLLHYPFYTLNKTVSSGQLQVLAPQGT